MSSGVAMVAPDSHWFRWLFRDRKNSLLSRRTFDDLVSNLDTLIRDKQLRTDISRESIATIAAHHSDWDIALGGVYSFISDPKSKVQVSGAA